MQGFLFAMLIVHISSNRCHSQLENQLLSHGVCPLWFQYNETLHSCQCTPKASLMCEGEDVIVQSGYFATYNKQKKIITLSPSKCELLKFNETTKPAGYVVIPRNLSRLNEYMCGLLNRKGYLCRDCMHGYGLAINLMGCTNKCYDCTVTAKQVMLYLIVEFVPLSLFYLFVLVFRISFTSAPMTCFILYSQVVVITFYYSWGEQLLHQVVYTETGELRSVSKLILILYGTFNLDFFRHALPPLCISTHLKPVHRTLLGYISAFYPLLLISLTWFCIKLHDSNFKPLVILWKPFHRCFVCLRRGWNTKNDLINVFSSFFLLSYGKIMYQTVLAVSTSRNFHYSLTKGYIAETYVLEADNTVPISDSSYIIVATFAILMSLIFNLLPILLLTFYPLKLFKGAMSKCRLEGFALTIFVEKFHSCYRDGLDSGRDMRSFSGFYFLLRILEFAGVIIFRILNFEPWFVRGTLFSFTAVVIALCRPYKKMYMNTLDTLLLSHMALMCHVLSSYTKNVFFVPFMQSLILIPFAVFTVFLLIRIIRTVYRSCLMKSLFQCCLKAESDVHIQQELNQSVITYGTINEASHQH